MCFALRVFHLVSPPRKRCRGELALHFCCFSGLGRAGPLKLLLNPLQPGLNLGEAEGWELWLLPNLPQTVLLSSALASPRTLEPSTPSQGQGDETRTYPTSPQPQDGEGQPLWPHPFCSESLPLSLVLFFEVGHEVYGGIAKISQNWGPWPEGSYKQKIQQSHAVKMEENRLRLPSGERAGGKHWESGISKCKPLYREWINNTLLHYGTGNYIQYHVINHYGKEFLKEYVYINTYITESLCCTMEIYKTL